MGMAMGRSLIMYGRRFKRTHCHRARTILGKLNCTQDNTIKIFKEY